MGSFASRKRAEVNRHGSELAHGRSRLLRRCGAARTPHAQRRCCTRSATGAMRFILRLAALPRSGPRVFGRRTDSH